MFLDVWGFKENWDWLVMMDIKVLWDFLDFLD